MNIQKPEGKDLIKYVKGNNFLLLRKINWSKHLALDVFNKTIYMNSLFLHSPRSTIIVGEEILSSYRSKNVSTVKVRCWIKLQ